MKWLPWIAVAAVIVWGITHIWLVSQWGKDDTPGVADVIKRRNSSFEGEQMTIPKQITLDIPETAQERVAKTDAIAETQRRMGAVVDAAVAWHQSGQEGDETWFDKAEVLGQAIDKLLEMRSAPAKAQRGSTAEPG